MTVLKLSRLLAGDAMRPLSLLIASCSEPRRLETKAMTGSAIELLTRKSIRLAVRGLVNIQST